MAVGLGLGHGPFGLYLPDLEELGGAARGKGRLSGGHSLWLLRRPPRLFSPLPRAALSGARWGALIVPPCGGSSMGRALGPYSKNIL